MMRLFPPATSTGVAAGLGLIPWWSAALAGMIGVAATIGVYGVGGWRPLLAALLAGLMLALLAKRQIGGYTGDVLGATEQLVEISVLLSILPLP
jgi:adenosylcobinamide-GDP ribazoletransferase